MNLLKHKYLGDLPITNLREVQDNIYIYDSANGSGLLSKLSVTQNGYFAKSEYRFYDCIYPHDSDLPLPRNECQGFVPDIWFDENHDAYLLIIEPCYHETAFLESVAALLANTKKVVRHISKQNPHLAALLYNAIAGYVLVEKV